MDDTWKQIDPENLQDNFIKAIGSDWMLVSSGGIESWNTMTAAWGGVGFLWQKPVSFVFVRFSRYTFEFMETNQYYSLSFFPEQFRKVLQYCGTHSGRDVDKARETGLTPVDTGSGVVGFDEARLILVCRKISRTDILEDSFLESEILSHYPEGESGKRDLHRMYIGEITAALSAE